MEKTSSLRCQLDSEKVQLTFQILPSMKKSLDRSSVSPLGIVVCPVIMFCISWVTTYVANDVAENLICSWNYHMIPGPQGWVPIENMQLPAELIPTVREAVKMCEERGGSLACEATFATDPLVIRADLIDSHETVSQYVTFRRKH